MKSYSHRRKLNNAAKALKQMITLKIKYTTTEDGLNLIKEV